MEKISRRPGSFPGRGAKSAFTRVWTRYGGALAERCAAEPGPLRMPVRDTVPVQRSSASRCIAPGKRRVAFFTIPVLRSITPQRGGVMHRARETGRCYANMDGRVRYALAADVIPANAGIQYPARL